MIKGGFKQQMQAEGHPFAQPSSSSVQTGPIASKLAKKLLERWCWGHMSLPTVRSLAEAAVEDGLEDPFLR